MSIQVSPTIVDANVAVNQNLINALGSAARNVRFLGTYPLPQP